MATYAEYNMLPNTNRCIHFFIELSYLSYSADIHNLLFIFEKNLSVHVSVVMCVSSLAICK